MDVHLETPINASADVVWGILAGKFAEIDQWSTAVDKSWALSPENAPKGWTIAPSAPIPGRATVNRIGELHEWFIQYSEENKEFTFRGHGLPRIITYTANTSKVTSTGENSCVLSFDVHVEFMGPFSLLGLNAKTSYATAIWSCASRTKSICRDRRNLCRETSLLSPSDLRLNLTSKEGVGKVVQPSK